MKPERFPKKRIGIFLILVGWTFLAIMLQVAVSESESLSTANKLGDSGFLWAIYFIIPGLAIWDNA